MAHMMIVDGYKNLWNVYDDNGELLAERLPETEAAKMLPLPAAYLHQMADAFDAVIRRVALHHPRQDAEKEDK